VKSEKYRIKIVGAGIDRPHTIIPLHGRGARRAGWGDLRKKIEALSSDGD